MAMTTAQRQAAYRARQKEQGEQISVWLDAHHASKLRRLAKHYGGTTQREALHRAIAATESAILDGMSAIEVEQWYKGYTY